jgi:hypothetical protein
MLDSTLKCHCKFRSTPACHINLRNQPRLYVRFFLGGGGHLLKSGIQTLNFSGAMNVWPAVMLFLMKPFRGFMKQWTKNV